MTRVLAFDLGGSRLKAALVRDLDAGPVVVHPTAGMDAGAALAAIEEVGRELLRTGAADAVAIGVPGIVDRGRVVALPGKFPGLVSLDLAARLADMFDVPAVAQNDALAAALGEAATGAGRGHHRVALVTIGTGVGTAVVEDGRPLGAGPLGGGILAGQMPLETAGDLARDTSGRGGTIEAAVAARRLIDHASLAGLDVRDVETLAAAWSAHDDRAVAAIESYRAAIVPALLAVIHAYAPSVLVIGGGVLGAEPGWLLDGLQAQVDARLWPGVQCALRPAALGDAAALVGGALVAHAQLNAPK